MATKTVLVIGGTGAQGVPIVQELDQHGYHVRVLTRDPESEHSQRLRNVAPNVQYVTGTPTDVDALRSAFAGVDYAFVNLNSFALGIKNEIYWGIRTFEIAVQSGVKHYIWSSLDNYALETKYDDDLRCGHYYGKGHHPKKSDSGVYDFRLPIDDGIIPYWTQETGLSEEDMEHKIGTSTAPGDPSLLTFRQNFSAWWRIYQNCGTKLELCKRDYKLLDEIYPGRIRSLKQWMEKVGYDGDGTRTFEAGIPWGM
ncbi:hypothetical protein CFAM422_012175 [Trichoderma lentiforme]|uniref:NmrA-like domain-containing protein n=1 Tax=Trichoderma lentiforme TaxID=1567552 RepID=A0A9P5C6K8_9HYPO|nr:hypothetical protein CFAM422_012175 [Trichoderma lentiforme]